MPGQQHFSDASRRELAEGPPARRRPRRRLLAFEAPATRLSFADEAPGRRRCRMFRAERRHGEQASPDFGQILGHYVVNITARLPRGEFSPRRFSCRRAPDRRHRRSPIIE